MVTISTLANIFYYLLKGLACQTISTLRSVSLSGVKFFNLKIRISLRKRIF